MFIRPRKWLAIVGALVVAGSVLVSVPQTATAANAADFDPGYIITDAVFFNAAAMDEGAIQAFLRAQLPSCAQTLGVACLPNYVETTVSRAASTRCAAYAGAANEPASRIINKVAKACGINPQVLIVTLQKENGLVTKGSPSAASYRTAMGYACPDTAACDAQYFGFFNQVYSAASQFIRYGVTPSSWRYHPGAVAIQFHPNAACSSTVVNIRNQATADLYNYTPYQPNAAAMANLGGTGDACSSYGNRNFWVYFSNWFGSPTGNINPFGAIDAVAGGIGEIRVAGWVIDPDATDSLDVHVYIDGVGTRIVANGARPDLAGPYPTAGTAHGFSAVIAAAPGLHTVCLYGINVGPGSNTLLGCGPATVPTGSPRGSVDTVVPSAGAVTVSGWAFDPDSTVSIPVHVYVDNVGTPNTADQSRPDIATAFPGYGDKHGFSTKVTAAAGAHTICAYAIDVAGGQPNATLGCAQVTVPGVVNAIPEQGRVPIGAIDTVAASAGSIAVTGWAIDPDTAAPISVHVYIDTASSAVLANVPRSDILRVYPAYGANHGYGATIAATPGVHQVCAYAINTAAGGNAALGCGQVTVPTPPGSIPELGRAPIGFIDSLTTATGSLSVAGWSIDPDTAAPIQVHVYVDTVGVAVAASVPRSDIATAYPAYGPNHGFSATLQVAPGSHKVCVYAINNGAGGNPTLACQQVMVPGAPGAIVEGGRIPVGVVDSVVVHEGTVTVSGWAYDPDTASPIAVHIYVDTASTAFTADAARTDIATAFPAYGANHGFSATVSAASGSHRVCVYAINTGAGGNPIIGCGQIVVP